jgi:exonuclease SbcC
LAAELDVAEQGWGALLGRHAEDERRRKEAASLQTELERQRSRWATWESLRELIGAADGARFRNFAQGLTLDLLVDHANVHLEDLARRYELQRVPGAEMDLQVIDREMGDEVRGTHSLSGGETFLVSLALALGLASLASSRVQVESLFIDEGFGALDADSLDMAIASLDALYSLGRQVGVISHVSTLVERIGVKVQIDKQGGGRSRLSVVTG